jgi:two-component system OmpR family sensor kinase
MSHALHLASRFSLRLRLTFLAAAAAAVVLTVGALLLYGGLRSAIDNAVTTELRVRAQDVAADLDRGAPLPAGGGLITQVLTGDGRVLQPPGADPLPTSSEIRAPGYELVFDRSIAGIGAHGRLLLQRINSQHSPTTLVAVAGSTAPIRAAQERLVIVLGAAGPAMVMAVAAMSWVLTGAALRPVSRMTSTAQTISLRHPDSRLPQPAGRDEIASLAGTLNAMLGRIADTMAHERAFIDDASHELRSPLAVLRGELELGRLELREGQDPARTRAVLDSALEETDRLVALTERLLVLARADAGRLVGASEPVALDDLVRRVLGRIRTDRVDVQATVGDMSALADPVALEQLLANVIANAAAWASSRVQVQAALEDGVMVVQVADDGPGFDTGILDRVFDRFSRADTTRARSDGTGLGLAIVAAIADALGGSVTARNGPPLGGAVVEIRLPSVVTSTDRT